MKDQQQIKETSDRLLETVRKTGLVRSFILVAVSKNADDVYCVMAGREDGNISTDDMLALIGGAQDSAKIMAKDLFGGKDTIPRFESQKLDLTEVALKNSNG